MNNKRYAYVLYNKRTCVTGRALWEKLKETKAGGYIWRKSIDGNFKVIPSLVVRWGNSMQITGDFIDLNPREAVRLASSKGEMMDLMVANNDVPTPACSRTLTEVSVDGFAYIRDGNDHVRYADRMTTRDKYALEPIDKQAEYRIHVFDGKTIGVYQKIPHDNSVIMYKNDTCDFVRIDQADKGKVKKLKGARPAAVAATKALGLLFSGVDVIIGPRGGVFVNEVNSAPALNEPNLDRWATIIGEHLGQSIKKNNQVAIDEAREEEARVVEMQRAAEERERRNRERIRLRGRFITEAEREGFTLDEILR